MPTKPPSTGKYAKCYYRSAGTFPIPTTWTELDKIRDLNVADEKNAAEASTRGDDFEQSVTGHKVADITFQMRRQPDNVAYRALRKAQADNSTIDLLILSGTRTVAPNEGFRGPCKITGWSITEGLNDTQVVDVTAKPTVPSSSDSEEEFKEVATATKGVTSGSGALLVRKTDIYWDGSEVTTVAGSNEYLGQVEIEPADSDVAVMYAYAPAAP